MKYVYYNFFYCKLLIHKMLDVTINWLKLYKLLVSEVVQAIRDMTTTLTINQRLEGMTKLQSLAKFRRNKP